MSTKFASQQPAGYVNFIKNVAIVGAGGRSGGQFAKALLAGGKHNISALTRVGSTSQIPPGITSIPVDYEQPETLVSALRGQDALIITLNARMVKTEQPKLVAAAARAGVPWVFPNECGPDPHDTALGDAVFIEAPKREVRAQIEAGGMSWVGLITGFWYEYSLSVSPNAFGFDLNNKKVTFFDDGNTLQDTTTLAQSGQAMAGLLSLKLLPEDENDSSPSLAQYRNGFAYVNSFLVSQHDILDSVLRVTGDRREGWTVETQGSRERYEGALAQMKAGDMSGFQKQLYTRVMYPGGGANFSARYKLSNEVLGLEKLDLDAETRVAVEMARAGRSVRD